MALTFLCWDFLTIKYTKTKANKQFYGGDGIVTKGVENTIHNIAILGHDGMRETDKKIIEIMTNC